MLTDRMYGCVCVYVERRERKISKKKSIRIERSEDIYSNIQIEMIIKAIYDIRLNSKCKFKQVSSHLLL